MTDKQTNTVRAHDGPEELASVTERRAVRLEVQHGSLCLPAGLIASPRAQDWFSGCRTVVLFAHLRGGDVDTVPWPRPHSAYWPAGRWSYVLRSALYDARECGLIASSCRAVELPDGTRFVFG